MTVYSRAYRRLVAGPIFILGDGVALEARGDDGEFYLVVTGDGKRIGGYLAVILTAADGFPLIGDLLNVKGKNVFKPSNKREKRQLKKFEKLVAFLTSPNDSVRLVKRSVTTVRKESELDVFLRLISKLRSCGVVKPGDVFAGGSVYGSPRVRLELASMGILNGSPVNEGSSGGILKTIYRFWNAGVELAGKAIDNSSVSIDLLKNADLLLTSMKMLLTGQAGVKTVPMRHMEKLQLLPTDLGEAMIAGYGRRLRSGIAEGINGVLKTPFKLVNSGKKLQTKGYENIRKLLHRRIIGKQIAKLGEIIVNDKLNLRLT